jgi:hypothetical protein
MQQIVEEAVVKLGRPASEAARFVQLFQAHWIESLGDYMAYHDSPQLGEHVRRRQSPSRRVPSGISHSLPAGQVPVKLHAALVGMARERKVAGDDRRSEVRLACSRCDPRTQKGRRKKERSGS